MLCIYHLADHDGKGSAAIVGQKFKGVEFLGLNHDMEVPVDEIKKHDKIVVCDISLPMDLMFELNESKDLTWIDHHVSSIEEYEKKIKEGKNEIKGVRQSGTAAIMLTWQYFFPEKEVPEGVRLLALNDIFDLRDKKVRPFEYAFQALGVNKPKDKSWRDLFAGKLNVDEMVKKGEAIANMPQGYSEFYDGVKTIKNYDFMCNFFMNGKNSWNLSFYTAKDDVDVSKIASSFGGGGHRKAAGASGLKQLPEFLQKGVPHKE